MKHIRNFTLAAISFALIVGCESIPTELKSPSEKAGSVSLATAAATISICVDRAVPAGYVVVGTTMLPSCPGYSSYGAVKGLVNALTIRLPTSPMEVCITWPIPTGYVEQRVPSGYVVVATTMTPSCSDYSSYGAVSGRANALKIQMQTSPLQICTSWPIPSGYIEQTVPRGYVVVSTTMSPACTGYSSYGAVSGATNALVIRVPTSTMQICVGWPVGIAYIQARIPAGFAVVAATMTPSCPGYTSYGAVKGFVNVLTIRTLSSPMVICAGWSAGPGHVTQAVPAGYIATGATASKACAGSDQSRKQRNAMTIRRR